MDRILNADLSGIFSSLAEIVQDPTSNLTAAVLLVAVASLVLLILLVIAIFAIASMEDEDDDHDGVESDAAEAPYSDDEDVAAQNPDAVAVPPVVVPRAPYAWLLTLGLWILILSVVWVVGGVATSGSLLCESCHPAHPHVKAGAEDPHGETKCVSCHESGGPIASVTYMVPPRVLHFALGALRANPNDGYSGFVASAQCSRCHAEAIAVTTTNEQQGVRMSHVEPVEAGAQCLDCHAIQSGMISSVTVGMTPCLRCHDGKKAPSECASCHIKDVGIAVVPDATPANRTGRDLIEQPDCGGCHSQKRCDSCHGVRMPHTQDFMQGGHARAGSEDIWFNGGKTCGKCHTAARRPCTKCHAPMPAHPSPAWATIHQGAERGACESCHNKNAWMSGRDFCALCHDNAVR